MVELFDIVQKKYRTTVPVAALSGMPYTTFWDITVPENANGRANVIIPYPDGLNQSSAQGKYITIEHVFYANGNSLVQNEIFSNDPTIPGRKSFNLIPAGVEIAVDHFSPFYIRSSDTTEYPIATNIPKTGDNGSYLGMLLICLAGSFVGLMILRNKKH